MVGTLDEYAERFRRKPEAVPEEMNCVERQVIGAKSVRLEIPLTDRYVLKKIPDLLRGLASLIEFATQPSGRRDVSVIMEVQTAVRETSFRIRELYGLSKLSGNGSV